ncbi:MULTISPECIES: MarR family winged helix-turn-helix transcriptional regulator [unclassified Rhizobium]|uniref:MarR family winged helix-turn-helix transcriptional regulator n=1 Tax=unclassified Rhizobium TaxID=2613769 RepID=UPI001610FFB7|nr:MULTISPECIES: MarR family winged helix-turn-helix transcriptional regulator [unclassified Rhizobium]MBB3319660.1 DNA-binding MarR family transcriptional regulator [Rhizobium sp. BK181]MBB3544863.1 DNA-binding MarR family transcriptional regulator [Rhizobium sp. BK399]MCS3743425.1 DNA-binding MarR family transcriptional regulator [Rhizobium sp. BK661]MCS4095464.1 DNA-binding MarR family transcriptional regulator [Rhizobium sp. BK176]
MAGEFELDGFIPYRLNRASELISLSFARQYKLEFDLTRPEWRTLAALGSVGVMTATEIGAHSHMHKTKVSRAVRALEERHWLKRIPSETDRRFEQIALTSQGQQHYRKITLLARKYQETVRMTLGEEAIRHLELALSAIETSAGLHRRSR